MKYRTVENKSLYLPDMIAIPDYVSGATEHWGLVTYRETQFLVDEATASASNKIGVANTIAHELAHMWFGNLGEAPFIYEPLQLK